MADKTPPAPQGKAPDGGGPLPLALSPVDVIGAVQRQLTDLHNYLAFEAPHLIDPGAVMVSLERMAAFVMTLPRPQQGAANNGTEQRKAG